MLQPLRFLSFLFCYSLHFSFVSLMLQPLRFLSFLVSCFHFSYAIAFTFSFILFCYSLYVSFISLLLQPLRLLLFLLCYSLCVFFHFSPCFEQCFTFSFISRMLLSFLLCCRLRFLLFMLCYDLYVFFLFYNATAFRVSFISLILQHPLRFLSFLFYAISSFYVFFHFSYATTFVFSFISLMLQPLICLSILLICYNLFFSYTSLMP